MNRDFEAMSVDRLKFEYECRRGELASVKSNLSDERREMDERWDEMSSFAAGNLMKRVHSLSAEVERLESEMSKIRAALDQKW